MKTYTLFCLVAILLFGCAHDPVAPGTSVDPSINSGDLQTSAGGDISIHNPHKLWAAGNIYFDADHETVELVPFRFGGIHLNVLKFFETSCDDCLLITGASKNGDGTFNLSIEITHPFPNHKELTVFDPKLILMFQGSHVIPVLIHKFPLYPIDWRLSWRLMGDPEVLNADGYTYFWCPDYDSGIDLPIFKYWEGKYAFGGQPIANLNAFLNFYSNEDRHMLESGKTVEKTFRISLPTGPSKAGYALDVCWEPPINTPVINPVDDFPITANQPEMFRFKEIFNNGEPITDYTCCNMFTPEIEEGRVEFDQWYLLDGIYPDPGGGTNTDSFFMDPAGTVLSSCNSPDPDHIRCGNQLYLAPLPDGTYQCIGDGSWYDYGPGEVQPYMAFDIFELVIDHE
ncbi:MAG: hypothetical protein NTY09_06405 [bacterium]|nr:hypothetical protein [bacterium]